MLDFKTDPCHLVTTCPARPIEFDQVGMGHTRFRSLATYKRLRLSQHNVKQGCRVANTQTHKIHARIPLATVLLLGVCVCVCVSPLQAHNTG